MSSGIANGLAFLTSLQGICNGSSSMQSGVGPAGTARAMAALFPMRNSRGVAFSALEHEGAAGAYPLEIVGFGRREAVVLGMTTLIGGMSAVGPAFADFDEDYKIETQAVIERVKNTLALEKTDPAKAGAVATLRQTSNDWVAKYRREKSVAGRPSFSNMYSVLNAISGHYISFGPNYPIPVKRKDRILEEIRDAEKALKRGR